MRGRMSGGRINHQVVSFLLSGEQLVLTERRSWFNFVTVVHFQMLLPLDWFFLRQMLNLFSLIYSFLSCFPIASFGDSLLLQMQFYLDGWMCTYSKWISFFHCWDSSALSFILKFWHHFRFFCNNGQVLPLPIPLFTYKLNSWNICCMLLVNKLCMCSIMLICWTVVKYSRINILCKCYFRRPQCPLFISGRY